jgi:hypothetical protein
MRRQILVLLLVAGAIFGLGAPSQSVPLLTVTLLANPSGPMEANRQISISRDVGMSVALNGKNYWFFGDTYVPPSSVTKTPSMYISGSTAAMSNAVTPGSSPQDLMEIVVGSPKTRFLPSQFLPPPNPAYIPGTNGVPCSQWPRGRTVRWISGVATIPSSIAASSILVTYSGVCLEPSRLTAQSFGYGVFSTATNTWTMLRDVITPLPSGYQIPERMRFGWPVFNSDGTITMFSNRCTVGMVWFLCDKTTLYATTFPATFTALSDPASYNPVPVADVNGGMNAALYSMGAVTSPTKSLTYYFARLDDLGGAFRILSATKPQGPYKILGTAQIPGCSGISGGRFCYAFALHPDLSIPGNLYFTYFAPGSNGVFDHLAAALVTLPGGTPPSTTTSTSSTTTGTSTSTIPSSTTTTTVRR